MAGARNGVATKLAEIEQRAIYLHCAGHSLNLALQDASKQVHIIRDVLDTTRELVNFIKISPKRSRLFEAMQQEMSCTSDDSLNSDKSSLRPLCPARWTVRTASLSSVLKNYKSLLDTLSEVAHKDRDDAGAKASGLLRRLESFDVFFGIHLALLVFEPSEQCSKVVQSKTISTSTRRRPPLLRHRRFCRNETMKTLTSCSTNA
jgi:hypothetical protein